jgi:hypothetical protein
MPTFSQVSAPAGSYTFRSGTASQQFDHQQLEVAKHVNEALNDLAIGNVVQDQSTLTNSRFAGKAADGRKVTVSLEPQGDMTVTRVRVGPFGDEPLSRAVLDRLAIRLGDLEPEAIPDEAPSEPEGNPYVSRQAVSDEVMLRGFSDAGYHDGPVP